MITFTHLRVQSVKCFHILNFTFIGVKSYCLHSRPINYQIYYKVRLFQFFTIQVLCSTRSGYAKPINPLNTALNPIYHLLILLGAHPILHTSRIRVNMRDAHERK